MFSSEDRPCEAYFVEVARALKEASLALRWPEVTDGDPNGPALATAPRAHRFVEKSAVTSIALRQEYVKVGGTGKDRLKDEQARSAVGKIRTGFGRCRTELDQKIALHHRYCT